jgi:SEC-C motif-containing protein
MNCPCHSGRDFDRCCGRFISHRELPENAALLMRSRYCAFALGERDYLIETWHPDFRPADLRLDPRLNWIGLEIIADEERGASATVEFEARLIASGEVSALHERSEFVLQQGRWLYTSGELLAPGFARWRPGRNESCPCGSGRKFKRCCGGS